MRASSRAALALLAAFALQGILLIRATSPTTDEVAFHMVNGYAYLKTHDYRMSPANPALTRQWMALPWLFMNPKLDLTKKSWAEADSVPFSVETFYQDNRAIAAKLGFASRCMILLLGLALAFLVWHWATRLYGEWGGVLSLALFSFSPTLLGHSSIAHTDLAVTLFCTLTAYFAWRLAEGENGWALGGFAAAFGLACAAKYNAVFVMPALIAALLVFRGWKFALKAGCAAALGAFLVIWASYFFEYKPILGGAVPRIEEKIGYVGAIADKLSGGNPAVKEKFVKAALETPVPIPSYILGLAGIMRSHREPYLHYAFGRWTTDTQWYYYLFSFLIKMTLPFLLLLGLRASLRLVTGARRPRADAMILGPAALFFFMTCFDSTAVGIRYLLPVLPGLFVWLGWLAQWAKTSRKKTLFLTGTVALNAVMTLAAFPDYLSYFNPLVGGASGGYKYVRGSDVDWGQGLPALKKWLDKNGIDHVSLRYFGTADPTFYGIDFEPISVEETLKPGKKVYAISLMWLEHLKWAKDVKPTAQVGGCIFIYDFRN